MKPLEQLINEAVSPILTAYPDIAAIDAKLPYCTYQRMGGRPIKFMDGSLPDKKNAIVQINCWANSALEASDLIMKVEKAIIASSDIVTAEAVTEPTSTFTDDPNASMKGRMQDFSIWYFIN